MLTEFQCSAIVGGDMKTFVLYHANCPDGFGAAFAAWLKFGETAEYIPVKYGDISPQHVSGTVHIVDFSFSTYAAAVTM
jgi:uncharacterized protein